MKKVLCFAILLLLTSAPAWAATVTQKITFQSQQLVVLTINWTSANPAADFTADLNALLMQQITGKYFLYAMETDPGATAPTDNYDVALNDANGMDILGGAGADRDTENTEKVMPRINGVEAPVPIDGTITLSVANNAVNSANGTIKLYFIK